MVLFLLSFQLLNEMSRNTEQVISERSFGELRPLVSRITYSTGSGVGLVTTLVGDLSNSTSVIWLSL